MRAKEVLNQNKTVVKAHPETSQVIPEQTVFIKSGSEFHQVPIQNIKYIESDGNYVTFHTTKRSILARYKISEVLELLPKEYFTRIHRSYIIALKHIETVKKHAVVIDAKVIPISINYREGFIALIDVMNKK